VRRGKTAAAARTVDLLPVLRDELTEYAASAKRDPAALVFATATGKVLDRTNVYQRTLAAAVAKATEHYEDFPTGLTPHSLTRTYASIPFAVGEAPP
jgi:integrase